jgi:hypothetical protein
MKNLAIYLAVGASALLVTAASAAPLSADVSVAPESNIQNVRMVCNEGGRCWRERGERRVIIRDPGDSYGYAPRERYIERRGYDDRGGVGFRAPGVSVGIGTDRYWEMTKDPMKRAAEQSAAVSLGRILKRHRLSFSRRLMWLIPTFPGEGRSFLATVPQTKTPQSQQTREGKILHTIGR